MAIFSEEETKFELFYKEMSEMAPIFEPLSATFPALMQALRPTFARYQKSAAVLQEALLRHDAKEALSSQDQASMTRYIADRNRFERLRHVIRWEHDYALNELHGEDIAQDPKSKV